MVWDAACVGGVSGGGRGGGCNARLCREDSTR